MTSRHSCVPWCFALKGQCHKIFSLRLFQESFSPKPLKIHKFVDLQYLLHLWIFCLSGNLRICNLQVQYFLQFFYLQFADPNFCGLKTSTNLQIFIFLLTNTYLKCSISNFYQIKNSAKQTCSWLLDSYAIKGGNFLKRMFNSLSLMVKNLQFAAWLTNNICGFAICNLQINQKEICRHIYLKNLKRPYTILSGLGETESWKNPGVKNLVALSL